MRLFFACVLLLISVASCGEPAQTTVTKRIEMGFLNETNTLANKIPASELREVLLRQDILRKDFERRNRVSWEEASPLVYHPSETEEVIKVFAKFGDFRLPILEHDWITVETNRPWAGFWYPLRSREMFDGTSSPMSKFDRVLRNLGRVDGAAQWDLEYYDGASGDAWEGLCDAWAIASANYAEPSGVRLYQGVEFSVSDQKALLIKSHQRTEREQFGIRYRGNAETDGTYQDIRPEAFHHLAVSLLQQGKSFVIDDEPGVQVWSKPVFRVRYKIEPDLMNPDAVNVTMLVDVIAERDHVSNELTSFDDIVRYPYHYRLYFDRGDSAGGYKVVAGEWTGASREGHPDFVQTLAIDSEMKTSNPIVDSNMDVVKRILGIFDQ